MKADIKEFNFKDFHFDNTAFLQSGVVEQQDSLRINDTTVVFDLGRGATDIFLTVQDSSNSKTDSIRAYVRTGVQSAIGIMYSNVSGHDLAQTTETTNVNLLIPGDGVTATYHFHFEMPIYFLYVVRMNNGGSAGYNYKTCIAIAYND